MRNDRVETACSGSVCMELLSETVQTGQLRKDRKQWQLQRTENTVK